MTKCEQRQGSRGCSECDVCENSAASAGYGRLPGLTESEYNEFVKLGKMTIGQHNNNTWYRYQQLNLKTLEALAKNNTRP
jgi:hypothetical protein